MTLPPSQPISPMHRRRFLAASLALLASSKTIAAKATPQRHQASTQAPATATRLPCVYLLRGFANIFSTGLDAIGADLRAAGVCSHVESHTAWRLVANEIIASHRQRGPLPVILIGHSLGANAAIFIAELLDRQNIRVDYIASFAATAPDPLPGNVRRAVNFYFSQHGWGLPLRPGPAFRGRIDNRDFSGDKNIGHFNIEKQRPLQREVVAEVLSLIKKR